jgi:hypothetical protein
MVAVAFDRGLSMGGVICGYCVTCEKRFVEFRCKADNTLNYFHPAAPNTALGAPGVGTITGGNGGRSLQLSLRLHY